MLTLLKFSKIVFLLGLLYNSAYLRPSVDSDKLEALNYKETSSNQTTSNHSFNCPTDRESVPGITYDEKGRYYSVSHHGLCPHPDTRDWKCNADYKQCKNGKTYHCAKDSLTGAFTDGCAFPVFCERGKEPIIQFPEGLPTIECRPCDENHFNTANISSDTYSECARKVTCVQDEEIECEVAEGIAPQWTQRRCKCNWKMNYIPKDLETKKLPSDFCLEDVTCVKYECNNASDGKRQERLSDYSCVPVCDPGSHRINESGACVFKESKITKNATVHETTITKHTLTSSSITDPIYVTETTDARTTQLPVSTNQGL